MIRFREINQDRREAAKAVKANAGDKVRVFGDPDVYVIDSAGIKLLKVHAENNPNHRRTVFRKDTVKVVE